MEYSLSISEAAELDIRDAFLWYQDQKDNLGLTFEKHLSKTIQTIQKNPLKIQIRYNQTRVAFLKKFPYGVHFNVIERRYKKGLVNLFDIYMDLVDAALIFDNSFGNHELIAEKFETEKISILNDEKFNALKQYYEQAR